MENGLNGSFFEDSTISYLNLVIPKLYGREKQSDKAFHLFRCTSLPYSNTAIRKLLRTGQHAYDRGTKAMHRFTSRTPRFDSPRGKELYGRPGTPGGSTAPICRNCTSGNR